MIFTGALGPTLSKALMVVAFVVGAGVAILTYGRVQYHKGVADTENKVLVQSLLASQEMQRKKDAAETVTRLQMQATDAAKAKLAAVLDDTERMLGQLRGKLKHTQTCPRLDDTGDDWLGLLGKSWADYKELAGETARLADKVAGLQRYVESVQTHVRK